MCVEMGLYFSMPQAASETRRKGKKLRLLKKKKMNKILTASRKHYF